MSSNSNAQTTKQQLLLDTNVWTYLNQSGQVEDVRRALKGSAWEIAIAPGVVYEILRTKKAEYRNRDIALVTRGCWTRLMPEAYSEAEELLAELRRLRPNWLLEKPDTKTWVKYKADWSGGAFWKRARKNPASEARILGELESDVLDQARAQAAELKESLDPLHFDQIDLNALTARYPKHVNGWNGSDLEPWRIEAREVWGFGLFGATKSGYDSPYVEWIRPWVDLARIRYDSPSWTRFWLHEVDRDRMQRHWVRWAVGVLQATRTATGGGPVDNQISSYLPDCTVVITADKAFGQIVQKVQESAPVDIATAHVVRGNEKAVVDLLDFIAEPQDGLA